MNREQAQFILRAFRPDVDRSDAPEFAQAFEHLRQDPQLARWFEREMAADAVIRRKLAEAVTFPAGLRERIAATGKVVRPAPRVWWRRSALVALAASVVFLLTVGALYFGQERGGDLGFAAFRESMVDAGQAVPHVSFKESELNRIREHLRSEKAPDDFLIPAGLDQATLHGCHILEWQGHKVSMVCLHLRDGGHMDLYIIQDVEWDGKGPNGEPLLAQVGQMNTVSWSSDRRTYMLVASATDEALRRLLSV